MHKLRREVRYIESQDRKIKNLILRPDLKNKVPGILWIHGGGYVTGGTYMVYFSEGMMLAEHYGMVLLSPEYTLARKKPYPAALEDCYSALEYLYEHADELNVDKDRIIVGGESAGGGLAAAVTMYARDKGEIPVALHMPLYPMLDCDDNPSSENNPGLFWGTVRNRKSWKKYLGEYYGKAVPKYASPAKEKDYAGMPPCYTLIRKREPFYDETMTYIDNLKKAGVEVYYDVFEGHMHGFDLWFWTKKARKARECVRKAYENMMNK